MTSNFNFKLEDDNKEVLYRFEDVVCAPPLYDDNYSGSSRVELVMLKLPILKHTPCGVWIGEYGNKKFVNLRAKKCFACPTVEEAMESFLKRKERQRGLILTQLERVKTAIDLIRKKIEVELESRMK